MICFLDETSAHAASLGLVQGDHNKSNPYYKFILDNIPYDKNNKSNPYHKFILDNIPYDKIPYAASLGLQQDDNQYHSHPDYKSILDKIPYNKIPYSSSLGLHHGGHHFFNHHSAFILDKILENSNTQLILTAISSILTSIIFNFISNFTL